MGAARRSSARRSSSRRILVTGASRGIGREIARLLVRMQYAVLGVHRKPSNELDALEVELGSAWTPLRYDLTRDDEVEALLDALDGVTQDDEPLEGLVLNAGVTHRGGFDRVDGDSDPLEEQLIANLRAPLRLLRALLGRGSIREPGGSIVVMSSNIARRGVPGKVAYAASKAGLEGAVRSLAHEIGPRGLRINAVAPGLLRTDMTSDLDDAAFAAYSETVPLRRVGEASDIAPLVAFLLGPEAAYITGQCIDVDGGWGA